VTGDLGDGAAGLKLTSSILDISIDSDRLLHRFYSPQPQIESAIKLRGIATACIDISDGLVADLGHICQASHVAATIYTQQLPIAADVRTLAPNNCIDWALFGGDDYQLCFTVTADKLDAIEQLINSGELNASKIGIIDRVNEAANTSAGLVTVLDSNNSPVEINKQGYDHFG
jgi:thiamine-monophosphate kinase